MSNLERSPISHDQYAPQLQHTDGSESSSDYQPANSSLGQRLIDDVQNAARPIPELTQPSAGEEIEVFTWVSRERVAETWGLTPVVNVFHGTRSAYEETLRGSIRKP